MGEHIIKGSIFVFTLPVK